MGDERLAPWVCLPDLPLDSGANPLSRLLLQGGESAARAPQSGSPGRLVILGTGYRSLLFVLRSRSSQFEKSLLRQLQFGL